MKALALLASGLALAGCASAPQLAVEPTSTGGQGSRAVQVALGETKSVNGPSRLPTLLLTVTNTTNADESFGPANVSVTADGRSIRAYTGPELMTQIRREAEFRRYAAQTRAEVQAQAMEQDPFVPLNRSAIEVRANGLQESTAATWAERNALAGLGDLLAPVVVKPGELITRRLVLHAEDLRGASAVLVHIQLGNEVHTFTVRVNG